MQLPQLNWPPTYTVRYSERARRVNLKFRATSGLEIVVPKNFKPTRIPQILEQNRRWIEQTQQKIVTFTADLPKGILPIVINLLALNQTWQVHYAKSIATVLHLKQIDKNNLLITGCVENIDAVKKLIHQWLKRIAQQILIPRLQQLSVQHNLPFAKAHIRNTQTHWGSCTAKHNISLSTQLLFVTPELVDYVLIHELCHTQFLDHSKNFWDLCESISPNCKNLRRQLRLVQHTLPSWLS